MLLQLSRKNVEFKAVVLKMSFQTFLKFYIFYRA